MEVYMRIFLYGCSYMDTYMNIHIWYHGNSTMVPWCNGNLIVAKIGAVPEALK